MSAGEGPGTDAGMYGIYLFLVVPDLFPHFQPPTLLGLFVSLKVYLTNFCIHYTMGGSNYSRGK